ncbi:hypothetical protein FNF28_00887 [Cafeteria roenbergensis]|uniref:Clu domain-containing protein n=1 Tax=Cafeteria roenbergensis TaxID=33653 RepID=A0A5A8E4V9_CAFRO|nr:hypothetical protein FNF28_00887 [Cafeteria roenbergensis]
MLARGLRGAGPASRAVVSASARTADAVRQHCLKPVAVLSGAGEPLCRTLWIAGSLVLHDSTGGARPVLVRPLSSAASETDSLVLSTDAEQWAADHLTQEEARTDAIDLALGVLSFSFVSPEVARARLELGQDFFKSITRLRAAKGLRSADNENIVELLGRLGTASMELAHCTDINAVFQHARVTLAMPGGEAQLAKWHRLGHLQSVAGGFAEVMAKPSALATVEGHAKKLLLEAKREAEEQAAKEKREAEEQAAKEKREAEEQAAARESRGKVLAKLDKAIGVVHKDLLEATAAELPERGDQSVEDFVLAQMQQRGGISAAVPGAVAAGVFSSIPSLPEGSRRIVPVYLHMGRAAYLYERHESAAEHGGAWLRCKFLKEHNLSMFLVIDEADEPYKKGGQFAKDLRDFIDQKWHMSYYVAGSAARMKDLLYYPRQLEGSEIYPWKEFKDDDMHSDKLGAQAALQPIQRLDEFAEAIECIGDEFAAPKLFRAAREWRSSETTRLRLAELVLQRGGVLRSLVADKERTDTELPLFKMRSDISAEPARLDIARIFYDRLIRKWPGLKSESVVGMLASGSLGSVTDVAIDHAALVATINERVASSHGQRRGTPTATEVESALSTLSDAGVLTLSGSFWAPASWTSALAILLSAEGNVELPYEQRVHLRYPTIGSTTTEPAMAGAFVKRGQQSTVFVDEAGHQPSAELQASLWKSMRALGRTDSHGLPAIEQVKWPKKAEGNFADWKLDSFLGPTPDSGVDVVILTTADRERSPPVQHLVLLQVKTSAAREDKTIPNLEKVGGIVDGFTRQLESCPGLVMADRGAVPVVAVPGFDVPPRVEQPAAAGAPRPETVGDKASRLRNKPTLTAHDHLERLEELAGVRRAFQRITEGAADAIARAFHDAKQRKRCGDARTLQDITQECMGRLRGGKTLKVVEGGLAGGVKVADPSTGAFFKIAEDTVGIYKGSSVMADKAAKHELAMLTHLHEADSARLLMVPLASCVDVTVRDAAGRPERVYRVQGFSRHAVGGDTLRVGSGDGGNTTHVCAELDGVAEELAAGLHLAPSLKAPISGLFTRHEYRRVRGDRDPDGFPRLGPATDALLESVGAGRHAAASSGVCAQVEAEHGVVLDPLRPVHAEHSATEASDAGGVPTRLPFDVELHALPWGEVVLLDTHRLCIPDVTGSGAAVGGQVAVVWAAAPVPLTGADGQGGRAAVDTSSSSSSSPVLRVVELPEGGLADAALATLAVHEAGLLTGDTAPVWSAVELGPLASCCGVAVLQSSDGAIRVLLPRPGQYWRAVHLTALFRPEAAAVLREAGAEPVSPDAVMTGGGDAAGLAEGKLVAAGGVLLGADNVGLAADAVQERLVACWRAGQGDDVASCRLLKGEIDAGLDLLERCRNIYASSVGEEHPSFASTLYTMAQCQRDKGKYDAALDLLERCRDIFASSLGEQHPRFAETLQAMAHCRLLKGEYDAALGLLERCRDVQASSLGEEHPRDIQASSVGEKHPSVAKTLYTMAQCRRAKGEYDAALELLERCRDIQASSLGEEHPSFGGTLFTMAQCRRDKGEIDAALDLLERCRGIYASSLGEEHPSFGGTLFTMAQCRRDKGEYDAALALLERCRDIQASSVGEEHPSFAKTLSTMAQCRRDKGEYDAALALLERCRDIQASSVGEKHPSVAKTLSTMAQCRRDKGEYDAALALLERCRDIQASSVGEKHPSFANTLYTMAQCRRAKGEYDAALALLERCRDIQASSVGEKHPSFANTLYTMAQCRRAKGEYDAALALLERCRDIQASSVGEKHPSVAKTLSTMAQCRRAKGEYDAALDLLERCRDIQASSVGEERPSFGGTLFTMAQCRRDKGEYDAALELLERCRDIYASSVGEEHPSFGGTLFTMAQCRVHKGEIDAALHLLTRCSVIFARSFSENHPLFLHTRQAIEACLQ